jgi:hypothetical protein
MLTILRIARTLRPGRAQVVAQLGSFDAGESRANRGVAMLTAYVRRCWLDRSRAAPQSSAGLTLGGAIEPVFNPVEVMALIMKKGAGMVLLPVSCRRALFDLSDNFATRVQSVSYLDAADALWKALNEDSSETPCCVGNLPNLRSRRQSRILGDGILESRPIPGRQDAALTDHESPLEGRGHGLDPGFRCYGCPWSERARCAAWVAA